MNTRSPHPDVEIPGSSLPRFVPDRADKRGAAVPLMGPADHGSAQPADDRPGHRRHHYPADGPGHRYSAARTRVREPRYAGALHPPCARHVRAGLCNAPCVTRTRIAVDAIRPRGRQGSGDDGDGYPTFHWPVCGPMPESSVNCADTIFATFGTSNTMQPSPDEPDAMFSEAGNEVHPAAVSAIPAW